MVDPRGLEADPGGESSFWNCDTCNKKKENECEKKTCAEKYPQLKKCSYLKSGWSYKCAARLIMTQIATKMG